MTTRDCSTSPPRPAAKSCPTCRATLGFCPAPVRIVPGPVTEPAGGIPRAAGAEVVTGRSRTESTACPAVRQLPRSAAVTWASAFLPAFFVSGGTAILPARRPSSTGGADRPAPTVWRSADSAPRGFRTPSPFPASAARRVSTPVRAARRRSARSPQSER
jgi:hypothetical protein